MFTIGHVASALLASRRWDLDVKIVILANQFPDLVDKPARHLLGLVPYGRIPAHTLLALALTTAIVFLLDRRARRAGRWVAAWVVGYGLHLAADFADLVPLLWPFQTYMWPVRTVESMIQLTPIEIVSFVLEFVLIGLAVYVEYRRWQRRRREARLSISSQY